MELYKASLFGACVLLLACFVNGQNDTNTTSTTAASTTTKQQSTNTTILVITSTSSAPQPGNATTALHGNLTTTQNGNFSTPVSTTPNAIIQYITAFNPASFFIGFFVCGAVIFFVWITVHCVKKRRARRYEQF